MQVVPIDRKTAHKVVRAKHYRKTLGIFWEGFALVEFGMVIGVVTYGQPSAPIQKHSFADRNFRLYELSRLVVDDDVENGASYLIANSLKRLSVRPSAVISYADSSLGHCGIVYQATNWLYTGAVTAHDKLYKVGGELLHPTTVRDRYGVTKPVQWAKENGIEMVRPQPKHRYFYLLGSRAQKKEMLSKLKYPLISGYPKCNKSKYTSPSTCQEVLNT